jgi:hypothetical protein
MVQWTKPVEIWMVDVEVWVRIQDVLEYVKVPRHCCMVVGGVVAVNGVHVQNGVRANCDSRTSRNKETGCFYTRRAHGQVEGGPVSSLAPLQPPKRAG